MDEFVVIDWEGRKYLVHRNIGLLIEILFQQTDELLDTIDMLQAEQKTH